MITVRQRFGWLLEKPILFVVGLLLTCSIIFVIPIFAIFLLINKNAFTDYEKLKAEGKATKGVVTLVEYLRNTTINDRHPYEITYTYMHGNEKKRDNMMTMYDPKLKSGDKITVIYSDSASMIKDVNPECMGMLPYIFALIFLPQTLIGLVLLYFPVSHMHKKSSLFRNGTHGTGTVIRTELPGGSIFMPFMMFAKSSSKIVYSFNDSLGNSHNGSDNCTNMAIVNNLKINDEIEIIFDENNPDINCLFDPSQA